MDFDKPISNALLVVALVIEHVARPTFERDYDSRYHGIKRFVLYPFVLFVSFVVHRIRGIFYHEEREGTRRGGRKTDVGGLKSEVGYFSTVHFSAGCLFAVRPHRESPRPVCPAVAVL